MAMSTQRCDPGAAIPVKVALMRTHVKAVGPVDKRNVPPHKTPTNAGNNAAYKPVTKGMPANAA
jgi:hypothetical protein